MKLNKRLLPIKAHYFFFMAAMGPILPQINVYGKQLGISTVVMGSITAILPLMFLISKPMFGLIIDYFSKLRKAIFLSLLTVLGVSYALLYFLPESNHDVLLNQDYNFSISSSIEQCNDKVFTKTNQCTKYRNVTCEWNCNQSTIINTNFSGFLYRLNNSFEICSLKNSNINCNDCECNFYCMPHENDVDCLYGTSTFWLFVILMSVGTIGFNVANSVSDAICFDMLGEQEQLNYGKQRVWGTIGFGLTALLSGYIVDLVSDSFYKNYTPVFVIVLLFTVFDLFSCFSLKLPRLPTSENIFKDLGKILQHTHIVIFLLFATLAGIVDSFIVYFLFWYLEDLAQLTGYMQNIKFIEGLTVACETLVGEVIFFSISGKILKTIGYGHSLTFCFASYALRLYAISFIPTPWWILPIEIIMQGPTYALCYTTIVAYTSAISPPGTSATMQGIAAGMDDGFGYAIGSFLGGILYERIGGQTALRLFSSIALACAILHFFIYIIFLKKFSPETNINTSNTYQSPEQALKTLNEDGIKC